MIMIEQTFKRKPTIGLITLALAALFIYNGVSYTEYNFIPPIVKFISAGLAFVYAIWQFATPYVILNNTEVIIKKDVFSTKSIEISRVDNITVSDDAIVLKSGLDTLIIKLKVLGNEDRKSLSEKINKMKIK